MSQFLDSIKDVKRNWQPYDAWEQDQADDYAKRQYLSKKLDMPKDKVELTTEKAKIVLRASEMLDARSEDNCENEEMRMGLYALLGLAGIGGITGYLSGKNKSPNRLFKTGFLSKFANINLKQTVIITGVISAFSICFSLFSNEKQKEASRIGRFQAKNKELKDIKNFVIYTPEQIEAAKILAKKIPTKKEEKGLMPALAQLKEMSKDRPAYEKWVKEKVKDNTDAQKLLDLKFSPEQLAQGEEDKEIIVNVVKDINIKAEEYSENMENAFDTVATLQFLADIPIGLALTYLTSKFVKKMQFIHGIAAFVAPLLLSTAIMGAGLVEQKEASRVGRFVKRRELLNDPKALMDYSEEQLKQAEHIKAPPKKKGFLKDIIDDFKFVFQYKKDKADYDKYKAKELPQNEKFYDALKQSELSNTQLKDAKHLQEKTFMAFDKIDEMSQRYSEDVETSTEIAKQLGSDINALAQIGAAFGLPILAYKGKLPLEKLTKLTSKLLLKESSPIRKACEKLSEMISKDKKIRTEIIGHITQPFTGKTPSALNPKLTELISEFKDAKFKEADFKFPSLLKWAKNLVNESSKLLNKEMPDRKFSYKNYKTLINTTAVTILPAMGLTIAIPYSFNAWLTNIQKKAGKIGIMKAMEEVDHAQLYVNSEPNTEKA